MNARIDKRYGSKAWKRLRRQILARDHWSCWKVECTRAADTCDHIERVEDRPDLFWEPSNLRASCRYHNLFRHHPARVVAGKPSPDPELAEPHHPLVTPMRKFPRLY